MVGRIFRIIAVIPHVLAGPEKPGKHGQCYNGQIPRGRFELFGRDQADNIKEKGKKEKQAKKKGRQ